MAATEQLCALGFDKYWVNQALALTNYNTDCALEWLLSDEFKLAKEQYDREFEQKQTPDDVAMPEQSTNTGRGNPEPSYSENPLLDHEKEQSLQSMPPNHSQSNIILNFNDNINSNHVEMEKGFENINNNNNNHMHDQWDPNINNINNLKPDLKPKTNHDDIMADNINNNTYNHKLPNKNDNKTEYKQPGSEANDGAHDNIAIDGGYVSKGRVSLKQSESEQPLRLGAVVEIYSTTEANWSEGIIKETKGDLLCVVYGKYMKWLKKNSRHLRPRYIDPSGKDPKIDEFDYDVTFRTSQLGLVLHPDHDNRNCIVDKCLSKTTKAFVHPSSIIVAVNDVWVAGMTYDMILHAIKQAAKSPPLKIQFRVKKMNNNMVNKNGKNNGKNGQERGYLKIKVVAGVELRQRGSYCVIQVGNARLSTKEVHRHVNPAWQETLTFKNFRPDQGKKAIVTVYDHSDLVRDKKVGTSSYELPIGFDTLQRNTLELKSTRGKLSGGIILNTIIIHKRD